jgi:peptidyl-prolyl cis-trans isomerase D
MAKKTKTAITTKKHQARLEREQRQTRLLMIGMIVVVVLVIGSIGYGILDQQYLRNIRPVAIVNGDKITTSFFQAYTRYVRQQLINQATNSYQLLQFFGNDPQTSSYVANQLSQIQNQLVPEITGQQSLDELIGAALIKQEAARRGIVLSNADIEKGIQEAFDYYADGTPTPTATWQQPATSTLSPTQYALVSATPTATATSVPTETATATLEPTVVATIALTETGVITETAIGTPTITPTVGPTDTPTPYTLEGFQSAYQDTVKNLQQNLDFSEQDLKQLIEMKLYRKKVSEAYFAELNLPREEEQVWARHILVNDEQTAQNVLSLYQGGEDWSQLAAQFSQDTSNKDSGGDLGWFGRGQMVSEFEKAAFSLKVGEVSQPVKTDFGYHIIQVLGHETRPLSPTQYQQLEDQKFNEWLTQARDAATIKEDSTWKDRVPTTPELPTEIVAFIQQTLQSSQGLPQVATPVTP